MASSASVKLGVLGPNGAVVQAREIRRLAPAGLALQFAGFDFPTPGDGFCGRLVDKLAPPLETMKAWGADGVLLGCTTVSMLCDDPQGDAALGALAGAPVISAAGATRRAAQALGAKRLAVASPYGAPNNRIIVDFLERQGLSVVSLKGLGLDANLDLWRAEAIPMAAEAVLELCLAADVEAADAVYLPCTGVGSLDAIAMFEGRTHKPAFSAVQAGYWASLRALGVDGRRPGCGRLLAQWPA